MNEGRFDPSGNASLRCGQTAEPPLEYSVFRAQCHQIYLCYARLHLGSVPEAVAVVDDVFASLLTRWPQALREENLNAASWALLRQGVERHLAALDGPAALAEAAWNSTRRRPYAVTSEPSWDDRSATPATVLEHHCDVVLLSLLVGLEVTSVAHVMGIAPAAVQSCIMGVFRHTAAMFSVEAT
ncbi:sigma-70 family RNA polymerase sigma factor [Streptomyces sp. NPDC092307]|uniref:sigma-70 family RNA polymerase sigma factor n=1 Tax=Streptomyces sp. NPDC092307 TaxID=3366013 RepID=UPI00382142E9